MARSAKWVLKPQPPFLIGRVRQAGRIYEKGKAMLVIMPTGLKVYWPHNAKPLEAITRNSKGAFLIGMTKHPKK